MEDNKFVIISPFFNCEASVEQMLASIVYQTYKNWKIIFIDDMSTDDSKNKVISLAKKFDLGYISLIKENQEDFECSIGEKIQYISNKKKKWEVANILRALKICNKNDIIVRADVDDYISDLNCFEIINKCYKENDLDALWTAHRWWDDNGITMKNISGPLKRGIDLYKHEWCFSHLKTFKKYLLDNVKDENYRSWDGNYFKRIGDRVFFLPALHNAKKLMYLPIQMYAYYCNMSPETFMSQDAIFQKQEADYLAQRGFIT